MVHSGQHWKSIIASIYLSDDINFNTCVRLRQCRLGKYYGPIAHCVIIWSNYARITSICYCGSGKQGFVCGYIDIVILRHTCCFIFVEIYRFITLCHYFIHIDIIGIHRGYSIESVVCFGICKVYTNTLIL